MRHWRILVSVAFAPITVVEVDPFPSKADLVWNEDERLEFITYIAFNPMAGDVIPGSGGIRKVRWGHQGKGKRGGVRVIYYFQNSTHPLFLLTVYAKSRKDDLSPDELRTMKKLVAELRSIYAKD